MTVGEYIKQHGNEWFVIYGKETQDECDPFCWQLWEGMLLDTPEKLKGLEVVTYGWRIGARHACLEVYCPKGVKGLACP